MLCSAYKNKTSESRCSAKPLFGLQFCGTHARSKSKRLWIGDQSVSIVKLQKIWRGYSVRLRLKLAGPGVLKRSLCHNEEDLISCDEKDSVHPFDYFAITENDKIFWFDVRTIFQWSLQSLHPSNPYTKTELNSETRHRLKECVYYREVSKAPIFHDLTILQDREKMFDTRWVLISQIMEENLFTEVDPMLLLGINRLQFWEFTGKIRELMMHWKNSPKYSRHYNYYKRITTCWKEQLELTTRATIAYYIGGVLLDFLKSCKKPYDICFMILSARARL